MQFISTRFSVNKNHCQIRLHQLSQPVNLSILIMSLGRNQPIINGVRNNRFSLNFLHNRI
ncbi:Uncharacterised protein [Streptococcus pneumoniae]|nr:Uncharacterised protein [Streptococcus pneumoniae]